MWIALAIVLFLAGQVYLFRCLGRLDRHLERRQWGEPEREVLSIAFSDPATVEHIADLLERFSSSCPEIELVLLTGQNVMESVCDGRAGVGFLPANRQTRAGLNRLPVRLQTAPVLSGTGLRITPLEDTAEQEIIWKRGARSSPEERFVRFLREHDIVDSGNAR